MMMLLLLVAKQFRSSLFLYYYPDILVVSLCSSSVNLLTNRTITVTVLFALLKIIFSITSAVFRLVYDWFKF